MNGEPADKEYTKRYELQVMLISNIVLLVMLVVFIYLFVVEYKKKAQIEPVFLRFDSATHQVVEVERGNLPVEKQTLLRSSILREFVKDYLTVNHIDESKRFARIKARSSDEVFAEFEDLFELETEDGRTNRNSPLNNPDYFSKIEIIRDVPVTSKSIQVYFYKTETINGFEGKPVRYAALISYDYRPVSVELKDVHLNIDGITVTNFLVQREE